MKWIIAREITSGDYEYLQEYDGFMWTWASNIKTAVTYEENDAIDIISDMKGHRVYKIPAQKD